jgi:hypothetical protein
MELPIEIINIIVEYEAILSLTCKTYYTLLTPKAKVIAYFKWHNCDRTIYKWRHLGEYCKTIGLLIHATCKQRECYIESLEVEIENSIFTVDIHVWRVYSACIPSIEDTYCFTYNSTRDMIIWIYPRYPNIEEKLVLRPQHGAWWI